MNLTLTEKAIAKVKEYAATNNISASIRAGVKGGGCSGFSHVLFFDEEIEETDNVFETDGVKIIVDLMSMQYLDGTTIDYFESVMSSGFKFSSDRIKSTCGCGSSFSV